MNANIDPVQQTSSALPVRVVILIGPAGSGKTTVGQALAQRLGWTFIDADDLHSPEHRQKMAAGLPLTEKDRAPWLTKVKERITGALAADSKVVIACSGLQRRHREILRPKGPFSDASRFIYLRVSAAHLADRLRNRTGHFAPAAILDSQLAAFEIPSGEADVIVLDGEQSVARLVQEIQIILNL